MTMPSNLVDRELTKFRDTVSGPAVAVVNPDGTLIIGGSSASTRQQILDASDLVQVFSYSTVGNGKRLDTIVSTSAIVGTYTLTETFTWADFGTKNERVTNISWTVV